MASEDDGEGASEIAGEASNSPDITPPSTDEEELIKPVAVPVEPKKEVPVKPEPEPKPEPEEDELEDGLY